MQINFTLPFIKASRRPFWSLQLFCNYNNISITALLAAFIHIPRCVSFGSKTLAWQKGVPAAIPQGFQQQRIVDHIWSRVPAVTVMVEGGGWGGWHCSRGAGCSSTGMEEWCMGNDVQYWLYEILKEPLLWLKVELFFFRQTFVSFSKSKLTGDLI